MTNRIFSLFKFIEMYVNDDDTHEFKMNAMQTNNKNYHMRKLHEAIKTVQQNTTKRSVKQHQTPWQRNMSNGGNGVERI